MLGVDERVGVGDAQLGEQLRVVDADTGQHVLAVARGERLLVGVAAGCCEPGRWTSASSSSSQVNWTSVLPQSNRTASITTD